MDLKAFAESEVAGLIGEGHDHRTIEVGYIDLSGWAVGLLQQAAGQIISEVMRHQHDLVLEGKANPDSMIRALVKYRRSLHLPV